MELSTLDEFDIQIRQDNMLTHARYEMTSCEMDIFFYTLSVLKVKPEPIRKYRIFVKDIEEMTGRKYNYQQFRSSTKNLIGRVYEIPKSRTDGKINFLQTSLMASAEYITGEGSIEIELSEKIIPYLFDLKNNFTSYSLKSALSMTSKFAKRIYQIVSRWKDVGVKVYEVEQLRLMLKLKDPEGNTKEKFKKYSLFKINVLEIAKEQINEHTDLSIDYEEIKKGRSVHAIKFYINNQKPKQLPLKFEDDIEDQKTQMAKEFLTKIGINDKKLIKEIIKNHLDEYHKWKYAYETKQFTVKSSVSGHLLKTLGLR